MSGRYYIKKHRREKQTKQPAPQFVIRRVHPVTGVIAWQGRYYNLYKSFQTQEDCTAFVEGILNNNVDLITREMVVIKHYLDPKRKEIVVETKGICEEENLYFTERYEGEHPGLNQVENFIQACFIRWKVVFPRLNAVYVNKLYQRKQIGYINADRLANNRAA
jgi:hypothetical protein